MILHTDGQKKQINTGAIESVAIAETVTDVRRFEGEAEMTLLVKKPDYLGNSKWEFKDDKKAISAHISDPEWLHDFHNGEAILQPGSSLICNVRYRHDLDKSGNTIDSVYEVTRVIETIAPSDATLNDLFKDES